MKLLGSIIYVTSTFYGFVFSGVYLVHWTHSFLYFHNNSGLVSFQDGMFHKKWHQIWDKMRMDNAGPNMLY